MWQVALFSLTHFHVHTHSHPAFRHPHHRLCTQTHDLSRHTTTPAAARAPSQGKVQRHDDVGKGYLPVLRLSQNHRYGASLFQSSYTANDIGLDGMCHHISLLQHGRITVVIENLDLHCHIVVCTIQHDDHDRAIRPGDCDGLRRAL
jgi:hypothetical protein